MVCAPVDGTVTAPVYEELRSLVLKTSGLVDVLRSALAPLAGEIHLAFGFGSVAKATDTVTSDVDLLVVSDTFAYGELFAALEPATNHLQRTVNPTLYSRSEIDSRMREEIGSSSAFLRNQRCGLSETLMASPLENLTSPGKPPRSTLPTTPPMVFVWPHTLDFGPEGGRVLGKCRSVRNLGETEGALNIDVMVVLEHPRALWHSGQDDQNPYYWVLHK